MEYRPLGNTGRQVSLICLGTMTFGEQNDEASSHRLLDQAAAAGVNFFDAAEMYPVPPRAETQGETERILGRWLARRADRDALVIATKIAGPGRDWLPYIRGGGNRVSAREVAQAVDDSLRRLGTDHIDLYQVHWPERATNFFGKLDYDYPAPDADEVPILETLEALSRQVEAGKLGTIGISNETPWGTMEYLRLAEQHGLARIVSIQNPYSLLNRSYEVGLAEISHREQVGLLAYSPLGFGVLSGKYLRGERPAGSRLALFPHYDRYTNARAIAATEAYVGLAREHGIDPAQFALAFVNSRPFVTANIIGATTEAQLASNLASLEVTLTEEMLHGIAAIHADNPNPSP